MKKLLSLAMACTLTLGLASCGGTGTSTSSNAPASSSAVESPAAQFDAASYLSVRTLSIFSMSYPEKRNGMSK